MHIIDIDISLIKTFISFYYNKYNKKNVAEISTVFFKNKYKIYKSCIKSSYIKYILYTFLLSFYFEK